MKFRGLLRCLDALHHPTPSSSRNVRRARRKQPAAWQGLESLESRVLLSTTLGLPAVSAGATSAGGSGGSVTTTTPSSPAAAGYSLALPARDANGFTLIPALQSGHNIYVSSSTGNDANDGLTPATPKKSLAAGFAMLQNNVGDHLLLLNGDTFTNTGMFLTASGPSRTDPIVIGSYSNGSSTALPVIKSVVNSDGSISNAISHFSQNSGLANVLITDLNFYCSVRDPNSPDYVPAAAKQDPLPVELLAYSGAPVSDIEFCDCSFDHFGGGCVAEPGDSSTGMLNDIRFNRNRESNTYVTGANSGGDYFQGITNLLIDTCSLVNIGNGWTGQPRSSLSQGIYVRLGTNTSIVGCTIINADAAAIKLASDTTDGMVNTLCANNLIVGCAIGFDTSGNQRAGAYTQEDVTITNNVMTQSGATIGNGPICWGIDIVSIDGLTFTGNDFVNNTAVSGGGNAVMAVFEALPQENQTVSGNVSTGAMAGVQNLPAGATNVVTSPNTVTAGAWSRTLEQYDSAAGGPATLADFMAGLLAQTRGTWNSAYSGAAADQFIAGGTTGASTPTPSQLVIVQQPTSATPGNMFAPAFAVDVEDAAGNLVTSDNSSVAISVASGPANGALYGTTTVTAVNGVATFSNLSLLTTGSYTLLATDATLAAATSSTISVAAAASTGEQLVVTRQPANTTAGGTLGGPLTVSVEDASGKVLATDNSSITVSIASGAAGATLGGTTTLNAVKGVASFGGLALTRAGSYTLRVVDGALNGATTNSFNVAPAPRAQLVFVQQPDNVGVGGTISPQVSVDVEDAFGNLVTTDTSSITVGVGSGPTGAGLGGTTTVAAVGGVATFSNLSLLAAGTYTLKATDASAPGISAANSGSFSVTAGLGARLAIAQQPGSATAGNALNAPLVVDLQDALGNVVPSASTSVSVTIATGPAGASLRGTTTVTPQNGIATFSNLEIPLAGAYTLTVSATGLAGVNTGVFSVSAGAATQVIITQQPNSATINATFSQPLSVALADAYGNLATADKSAVQLVIASGPAGGSFGGATTVGLQNGMATFSSTTLRAAGTYTLSVIDTEEPGITPVTSAPFVINPAAIKVRWVPGGQGGSAAPPVGISTTTVNTTPPTAQLAAPSTTLAPTPGAGSLSFNVTYSDAQGMNIAKIGTGDVTVIGPHGFKQVAQLTAVDGLGDGSNPTATYSITPTGGIWSSANNGAYTIQLNAKQVFDAAGNAAPAQPLGTFSVQLPTVIDNATAGRTSKTGTWLASTTPTGFIGGNYLQAVGPAATMTFTPDLAAGNYGVYLNSPGGANLATNVVVDIYTANGKETTLTWNQQIVGMSYLGTFALGSHSRVVIQTTGANGTVIADAAMFV